MHNKHINAAEVVVAIVQGNANKFLLVHRKLPEKKLAWSFPSGKIEAWETTEQAAVREVLEETGVHCKAMAVLGHRTHPDTGRTVAYVLCGHVAGEPRVTEPEILDRVNWMHSAEVLSTITTDIYPPVKDRLETSRRFGSRGVRPGLKTLPVPC